MTHKKASSPELKTWAKLERRGEFTIVLGESSASTETQIKHDYRLLCDETRKLEQWAGQLREKGKQPTLPLAKRDFAGTILVGDNDRVPYLTDDELEKQIHQWEAPSVFSHKMIALRWKFTKSTAKSLVNRKPKNAKQ